MILESSRIAVRPLTPDNAEDVFEFAGTDYAADEGLKPLSSASEAAEFIKLMTSRTLFFGVELKDIKKIIGAAALTEDRKRSCENVKSLSFIINRSYGGRGYITEASSLILRYGFAELGLKLISSYCYPHNLNASRVLNKLCFSYNGRLECCERRFDGQLMDHDCYSLKAERFKQYLLRREAFWLSLHCD